jgi:hypothetical protein
LLNIILGKGASCMALVDGLAQNGQWAFLISLMACLRGGWAASRCADWHSWLDTLQEKLRGPEDMSDEKEYSSYIINNSC